MNFLFFLILPLLAQARGPEDYESIVEHSFEAIQNNRFLTIPTSFKNFSNPAPQHVGQLGYNYLSSKMIHFNGVMSAYGYTHPLSSSYAVQAIVFSDYYQAGGETGDITWRPLFLGNSPYDFPQKTRFSQNQGHLWHWGLGIASFYQTTSWKIALGIIYDQLSIGKYQANYQLLSGNFAGRTGLVDHRADYSFWVPMLRIQKDIQLNPRYNLIPQFTTGMPFPRRGVVGAIDNDRGDTERAGHGKHVGDIFAGFAGILFDNKTGLSYNAGVTLNQFFLEPIVHYGIETNILLVINFALPAASK